MSFGDHLEELRRRILWALALPLPLAIVTFLFSEPLIRLLYRPLDGVLKSADLPRRLQALGPAEVLMMEFKLSLIVAVVASLPWILWQTWLFVRPGLYRHERRFAHLLVPGSAVLTVCGVLLMYFVMLPLILRVLVLVGADLSLARPPQVTDPRIVEAMDAADSIRLRLDDPAAPRAGDVWMRWPQMELRAAVARSDGAGVEVLTVPPIDRAVVAQEFRLTSYVNFVLLLMLGIVIAFQMPLVILLLGWLGLVTEADLRARRKYAIFACAVVAAVITPPDALSMVLMLAPLIALYELSIVLLVMVPARAVAEGTLLDRFRGRR